MMHHDDTPERVLTELSAEFDAYVDLAIDLANGQLSREQEAAVYQRMRTDEMFRRVVEPVLESLRHPASSTEAEQDAWFDETMRAVGMPTLAELDPGGHLRRELSASSPRPAGHVVRARAGTNWRRWPALAAAAVLLAAVTIPTGLWLQQRATFITVGAAPAVEALVHLPDSSRAQLEPGSRLRYRRTLGRYTTRQLQFEGTGRFVANTGSERFELWTRFARISAQDARFAVRVLPDRVEIAVEDGLVSVNPLDAKGQLTETEAQVPFGITVQVAKPTSLDPAVDAGHNAKRITIDSSMRAVPTIPSPPGGRP